MKCQDICEKLSVYLDDQLAKEEKREVAEHLVSCQNCRAEYEALKEASSWFKDMPEMQPPPDFRTSLMEKIKSMPEPKKSEENIFHKAYKVARAPWYKVVAAAAVFGITIGITSLYAGDDINVLTQPLLTQHDSLKAAEHGAQSSVTDNNSTPDKVITKENTKTVTDKPTVSGKTSVSNTTPQTSVGRQLETADSDGKVTAVASAESVHHPVAPIEVVSGLNIEKTSFMSTTMTVNVTVEDKESSAKNIRSIAEKYHGSVLNETEPLIIKVPIIAYSAVLAEMAPLGEQVVEVPSQKDLSEPYKECASQLKLLRNKEAQIINLLDKKSGPDSLQLEKQLANVQDNISENQNKIMAIKSEVSNVKLIINFHTE